MAPATDLTAMQATRIKRLTETFREIAATRMQGLPVMNDALQVEAVGFTPYAGQLMGVLIAPWFMNLVLLPGADEDWSELEEGSKTVWELPSGEYEFTIARLDSASVCQSCALFSSVLEFPDQDTARAVAQTATARTSTRVPPKLPQDELKAESISRRRLLRRTLGH